MSQAGELQFEIPRGESVRARFQFRGERIEYRVRLLGDWKVSETSGAMDVGALCGQTRSLISSPAGAAAGAFEMTLSGGCDPAAGASEDPELAARLRALGYLQ